MEQLKQPTKVMDMTQGKPLPLILRFAIPLLIGNIFQQVYSIVDTMVAGYNLGDNAIAAIGATSALFNLIISLANGLNSGYGIIVTQRFGAHDNRGIRSSIAGMLKLNVYTTIVLTAGALLSLRILLRFMNIPDTIYAQAYEYIAIILAGMVTTVCYNMFASILRAFGNSRTSLYFLILSSVLNIGMDILFVAGLHMGVAGAALATVLAQGISAAFSGRYVVKNYSLYLPKREDWRVPRSMLSQLLGQGLGMGLMFCVINLGSIILLRANNALGETLITAHTSARRIIEIMMQPLNTVPTATAAFVGQNWGAQQKERIKKAIHQVMWVELGWSVFSIIFMFAFGAWLVRLTTGTSDAILVENAVVSIRWHLAFFPVLGPLFVLRLCMQSMGIKLAPVLSSCIELVLKWVAAVLLIPRLGFLGTCMTEPLIWNFMLVYLGIAYISMRRKLYAGNESMPERV